MTELTLELNPPAENFSHFQAEVQPEAAALAPLLTDVIDLRESLEQLELIFGPDADAGI